MESIVRTRGEGERVHIYSCGESPRNKSQRARTRLIAPGCVLTATNEVAGAGS